MGQSTVAYGLVALAAALLAGGTRWATSTRRRIALALRDPMWASAGTALVLLILGLVGADTGTAGAARRPSDRDLPDRRRRRPAPPGDAGVPAARGGHRAPAAGLSAAQMT
jgi:hypothetical protein